MDINGYLYGYLMNVHDDVREFMKEKSRRNFPLDERRHVF